MRVSKVRGGLFAQRHFAGIGIADQALSSGGNFLLGIMVARAVAPAEFGSFSVGYVLYLAAIELFRSLAGDVALVRLDRGATAEGVLGTGIIVGVALSGILVIWAILAGEAKPLIGILAVGAVPLLMFEALRYVYFADRRPTGALSIDAAWTTMFICVLVLLSKLYPITAQTVLGAWAGCGALIGALSICTQRVWPGVRRGLTELRSNWDLVAPQAGEFIARSGVFQIGQVALGAIVGFAALGAFRAAWLLVNPLNVVFLSVIPTWVPRLRDSPRIARSAAVISTCLALSAVLWGVLLVVIPDEVYKQLIGPQWPGASALVLVLALGRAALGARMGALVALRAREKAHVAMRATLLASPIATGGLLVGAWVAGVRGGVRGLLIGEVVAAVIFWAAATRSSNMGNGGPKSVVVAEGK